MSLERLRTGRPPSAPVARTGEAETGEEGQAMVFAVITFLFVFVMIFATFRAGWVSHRKMQLQNAADLAAYAGASVEANSVSMMAFLNRGQAFIYYNLMRYPVDCAVWSLFKEFKDHTGWIPGKFVNMVDQYAGAYFGHREAPDEWIATEGAALLVNASSDINELVNDAKDHYDNEVDDGLEWIQDIYKLNRAMAEATPMIIRREVYDVATANGATRVCMFPDALDGAAQSSDAKDMTLDFAPVDEGESGQTPYVEHETDLDRWAYKIAVDWGYEIEIPLVGINLPMHPGVSEDSPLALLGGRTMPIPEWFDATQAKVFNDNEEDYYQIRECWNIRDLEHATDMSHMGTAWPFMMNPAGHFHHAHAHFKMFGSIPVPWWGFPSVPRIPFVGNIPVVGSDYLGHDSDNHWHALSGWDFYTPVLPPGGPDGHDHHAVLLCLTCFRAIEPPAFVLGWDADVDLSTDVMLELDDADLSGSKYVSLPIREYWPHEQPSQYAPPLVLGDAFFKYGINVGAYRAPEQSGNWLADSSWGYFCVASAKSGPMGPVPEDNETEDYEYESEGEDKTGKKRGSIDDWFQNNPPDRVIVFRDDTRQAGRVNKDYEEFLRSSWNLYHIPWGAKLVPVKDALYDKDTSFLMKGLANGIWMQSGPKWRDSVGEVALNGKLNAMLHPGTGIPFNLNDNGSLEAIMKH